MLLKLFFLLLTTACGVEVADAPFWKAKEKYYDRVKEGEVLVAVKSVSPPVNSRFKNTLSLAGGGQVRAPVAFVFSTAKQFEKVATFTGYVENAKYNSETSTLTLDISAYGYKTSVDLKLTVKGEDQPQSVSFEVVRGPLQGFQARLSFLEIEATKTEIGMTGEYSYDQFPMPKFFLEFGLEVVFQKMALRLRQQVEDQFAKKDKA